VKTSLYIVQAGVNGPVKVGITDNVPKRLIGIQTGNHERVHLLATIPGGRFDEMALHFGLRAHRIHGEWFRWNVVTKSVVERFRAGQPVLEIAKYLRKHIDLVRRVEALDTIAGNKRAYRRHRRDPSYGIHYRRECSIMLRELDGERAQYGTDAACVYRAMRAAGKLRAVAA
jgi:hypothetical protein